MGGSQSSISSSDEFTLLEGEWPTLPLSLIRSQPGVRADRLLSLRLCGVRLCRLDGVAFFPRLTHVNLTGNAIAALPRELAALRGIKALVLDGNCIAELPPWLCDLPHLEVLSLKREYLVVELQCGVNVLWSAE